MVDSRIKTKWRKLNRKRAEYFKEYYAGETGDKNRERAKRNNIMKMEAGFFKEYAKKQKEKEIKNIGKRHLTVDGIELWNETYAMNNMINNLMTSTYRKYRSQGIIPKAIYVRKTPRGKNRNYLSRRQISMINHLWHTTKGSRKTIKERCEYLYTNWTKGEIGFRS